MEMDEVNYDVMNDYEYDNMNIGGSDDNSEHDKEVEGNSSMFMNAKHET